MGEGSICCTRVGRGGSKRDSRNHGRKMFPDKFSWRASSRFVEETVQPMRDVAGYVSVRCQNRKQCGAWEGARHYWGARYVGC